MEPGSVAGVPRHWLARRHLGSVIGMRLTMVGCSGSMPGPHSAASCYLLEADGFRLVVDLGNGAVGALQRYTALNRVDAVALSHLHADHCLDMCPLWIARKYSDEDPLRPIPVYAPAGAAERIARANDDPDVTGAFDFVTLTPGQHQIGPFAVTTGHVAHPVETFASGSSTAGTRSPTPATPASLPRWSNWPAPRTSCCARRGFPTCRIYRRTCTCADGRPASTRPGPGPDG